VGHSDLAPNLTGHIDSPPTLSEASCRAEPLTLALVVPAHNEALHIGAVLSSIPAWVSRIIVVDDASTDDTSAIVVALRDRRVRLIQHDTNRGVGGAMQTGYRAALEEGYDLVGKLDGDGQMRADELGRLVEPFRLGLADYTKGNRFYFINAARTMPPHRSFGNTVLTFLTKLASGYWHVYDPQCGYTVVRSAFLRLLDVDDLPSDYFFENDMLIKLNALGARVVDVPTSTIYGQEVSGVRVGRVIFAFPMRLIWRGTRRFWRKNLVTDFGAIATLSLIGLVLIIPGIFFGAYHWWLSATTGQIATTGTVMIAVLPIILGVQLGLQALVLSVLSSPGAAETAHYIRRLIANGEFS
jgi:dolichol-phosphate mannosyltransferase